MEPVCNANLPASMHTLDHLQGVANRASLHYTGESQLKEVAYAVMQAQYLWILPVWKYYLWLVMIAKLQC